MPVSVTMPRLGESVTEGTVTRWLKNEGERVEADEPLLEVSTDKVDTEIPAPAAGVLTAIKVGEDETVEVGVELAVIDEAGSATVATAQQAAPAEPATLGEPQGQPPAGGQQSRRFPEQQPQPQQPAAQQEQAPPPPPAELAVAHPQWTQPPTQPQWTQPQPAQPPQAQPAQAQPRQVDGQPAPTRQPSPAPQPSAPPQQPAGAPAPTGRTTDEEFGAAYVTPLVRKLAAEHNVDLSTVAGTGVGGRIRKQDVLEAARARQEQAAPAAEAVAEPGADAQPPPVAAAPGPAEPAADRTPRAAPSPLRGTTEKMSRLRTVIAQRMVESLFFNEPATT